MKEESKKKIAKTIKRLVIIFPFLIVTDVFLYFIAKQILFANNMQEKFDWAYENLGATIIPTDTLFYTLLWIIWINVFILLIIGFWYPLNKWISKAFRWVQTYSED